MARMLFPLILPVAALGLAACSGGGSDSVGSPPAQQQPEQPKQPEPPVNRGPTIPSGEEATRVFSQGNGDHGDVISDGGTLTARSVGVSGVDLNYGGGPTALRTSTAAIRKNEFGELTVTVDGVDHVFKPEDRFVEDGGEVYGYEFEDPDANVYYSAWSHTGEIDEFLAPGHGYAEVLEIDTNVGQPWPYPSNRLYAVFGTETKDADLAGLPTASYNGRARLDRYPQTGFVNSPTSRTVYNGDVAMTADFGAGTISGSISNMTQRFGDGNNDPIAGSITMNPAPFQVNAYQGTLTPDAAFRTAADIGSFNAGYSGAFYGPAAEETAGTISGTGTGTDGAGFNTSGYFTADEYGN